MSVESICNFAKNVKDHTLSSAFGVVSAGVATSIATAPTFWAYASSQSIILTGIVGVATASFAAGSAAIGSGAATMGALHLGEKMDVTLKGKSALSGAAAGVIAALYMNASLFGSADEPHHTSIEEPANITQMESAPQP